MNDPTLTSLSLGDIVLGEYRTRHVLHVLAEHNTSVTSLKLAGGTGSMRGQEQTQEISRMLKRNTSLRHLCLFGADVSDDDVAILCEAIKGEANSIVRNCYWSGWGSLVDESSQSTHTDLIRPFRQPVSALAQPWSKFNKQRWGNIRCRHARRQHCPHVPQASWQSHL